MKEITVEQFAEFSYQVDQKHGVAHKLQKFSDLSKEVKDGYLEEANYYLKIQPIDDWPVEIVELMQAAQLTFPQRQVA